MIQAADDLLDGGLGVRCPVRVANGKFKEDDIRLEKRTAGGGGRISTDFSRMKGSPVRMGTARVFCGVAHVLRDVAAEAGGEIRRTCASASRDGTPHATQPARSQGGRVDDTGTSCASLDACRRTSIRHSAIDVLVLGVWPSLGQCVKQNPRPTMGATVLCGSKSANRAHTAQRGGDLSNGHESSSLASLRAAADCRTHQEPSWPLAFADVQLSSLATWSADREPPMTLITIGFPACSFLMTLRRASFVP